MNIEEVVHILSEFNKWRRGLPPYEWNEDPSKQKELPYSAVEIGIAIDEAVDMLRQAASDMDREKKYEYIVKFFRKRSDKCIGRSADHYDSLDCARRRHIPDTKGELVKFFRRSVGEWEEVKE